MSLSGQRLHIDHNSDHIRRTAFAYFLEVFGYDGPWQPEIYPCLTAILYDVGRQE
jgi:hypothetical protein